MREVEAVAGGGGRGWWRRRRGGRAGLEEVSPVTPRVVGEAQGRRRRAAGVDPVEVSVVEMWKGAVPSRMRDGAGARALCSDPCRSCWSINSIRFLQLLKMQ
jgi:hypothetical protein